jgi:hypothetical protein
MSSHVEPSTVFALLRACLAGDEQGAASILSTTNPFALALALAAWSNQFGTTQFGSAEAWDRQLATFLAAGPVDSG